MLDSPPSPLPPAALADLLQDFARAPGNYLVRLGEPRALHAQLDSVAAWAVGRLPDELTARTEELREAAVFFVLRACFAPGNTHYQVLGLSAKQLTPEALRLRYRALIRLTHPDMGVQGLPSNAAGVVNRANEVLSDPDLRQRYDDELASQRRSSAAAQAPEGTAQIALSTSWSERWQSFIARYPRLVRVVPTVLGVGLLGTGLLTWLAVGSNDHRLLIVSRGPDEAEREQRLQSARAGSDAKRPSAAEPAYAPATAALSTSPPRELPAPVVKRLSDPPAPRPESASTRLAAIDPSDVPRSPGRVEPNARQTAARNPQAPAADEPVQVAAMSPARTEPARAPAPPVANNPAPALNPAAVPAPGPSSAPGPSTTQVVPPLFKVAAAPAPEPAMQQAWRVDVPQAKSYLADVIMSLERPNRAKRNNAYLADMNVKGSLLQPALQLMRRFPDVEVEHMNWSDSNRPGAMTVQGQVTVRAKNPDTGEVRKVNFRLNAEFWGTREGTVMASLNLREDD